MLREQRGSDIRATTEQRREQRRSEGEVMRE